MPSYTQDTRIAQLETPLGKDRIVLRRFDAVEGMNELFDIRIEAVSDEAVPSFSSALGRPCTVSFKTIDDNERHFNGILAYVQELGVRTGSYVYRLVLRPWLHYFSIRKQSRIFHKMSVPDIIREVFSGCEMSFKLHKSYPQIEYIAQYRESDLAFACRLMEQYGILYYFRHERDKHTLCMIDELSSADTVPGDTREYISTSRQYRRGEEHFYHWIPERRLTAGKVIIDSYDFKRPSVDLEAQRSENNDFADIPLMVEDWPHHYVDQSLGDRFAQVRMDVERGADSHFLAAGDCVSLFPGALVTMKGYPVEEQNKEYLALRCTHTFLAEEYGSGEGASRDDTYHGNYELIRSDRTYAPPIVTEKPFMHGPQTAKVVGDGEIDVDEHGRILVMFHWDRAGAKSRRVRLAHVWAGKGWGGVYIPRIGMEVIVDFIDGEPDKPIVIGSVYNGENPHPYPLPGGKNIAGWKSNTTPGGGGYNELIFDDTDGEELIRIHAQYDMDTTVEHDMRTAVKNNESRIVGADRTTNVGMSYKEPGDDSLTVGKNFTLDVGEMITFVCGKSKIVMKDDGTIKITAKNITVKTDTLTTYTKQTTYNGSQQIKIQGAMVRINDPLSAPGGLGGIIGAVGKILGGLPGLPAIPGIQAIADAVKKGVGNSPLGKLLQIGQKGAKSAGGPLGGILGGLPGLGGLGGPFGGLAGGLGGLAGLAGGLAGKAISGQGAGSGGAAGQGGQSGPASGGAAGRAGSGSGGGGGAAGQARRAGSGGSAGGAAGQAGQGGRSGIPDQASGGAAGQAGRGGAAGGAAGQGGSSGDMGGSGGSSTGGGGAAGQVGQGGAAGQAGRGGAAGGAAGQAGSGGGGGGGAAGQAGQGGAAGGAAGQGRGSGDMGGSGGSSSGGGGAAGQIGQGGAAGQAGSGGAAGGAAGQGGSSGDMGGSGGSSSGGGGAAGQVGQGGAAGQAGSGGAAGGAAGQGGSSGDMGGSGGSSSGGGGAAGQVGQGGAAGQAGSGGAAGGAAGQGGSSGDMGGSGGSSSGGGGAAGEAGKSSPFNPFGKK